MAVTQQRYTFDEWLPSPANTPRSELVDGLPVERMPTSWDHGQVVKACWRWLDRAERAGHGQVALGPVGVLLDPDGARQNVREPDLCFVATARASIITSKGIEGVPDLVIEVLSPGNRAEDLPGGGIFRDYERFGVSSYWVIDPNQQAIQQFALARGHYGRPVILGRDDVLYSPLFPGIAILVGDLFAGLQTPTRTGERERTPGGDAPRPPRRWPLGRPRLPGRERDDRSPR